MKGIRQSPAGEIVMKAVRFRIALLPVFMISAVLTGLSAGNDPSRFELFFTIGPGLRGASAAYANAYDPNPGYKIPGSCARQTLTVDPAPGWSWSAGGTWSFAPRLGVQLSFAAGPRNLEGENAPFEFFCLYTTMFPPDYVPFDTQMSFQRNWPRTEGSIRESGGTLALVFRLPASPSFEVSASGGISLNSAGGRLRSLGFTDFWLGGHGVAFTQDYEVRLKLPSKTLLGAVLNVNAAVRLSGRFWLRVEAEYRKTGTYEALPEIDEVFYADTSIAADREKVNLIKTRFDLGTFSISLSRFVLRMGIAIRL